MDLTDAEFAELDNDLALAQVAGPYSVLVKQDKLRALVAAARRERRLREKALALCRELQCPAIEYLNKSVQDAWTALFDEVEPRAALAERSVT